MRIGKVILILALLSVCVIIAGACFFALISPAPVIGTHDSDDPIIGAWEITDAEFCSSGFTLVFYPDGTGRYYGNGNVPNLKMLASKDTTCSFMWGNLSASEYGPGGYYQGGYYLIGGDLAFTVLSHDLSDGFLNIEYCRPAGGKPGSGSIVTFAKK